MVKRFNMRHYAKFRSDRSIRCWDKDDFSIVFFSKWRPSAAILELLCTYLDYPRTLFDGINHCAKFGWNRYSSFDEMSIFNEFGLKMPIQVPKWRFRRNIWPVNRKQSRRDPQNAPPCVESRHTKCRSLWSAHPFLHSSPFYPIPRNTVLWNGSNRAYSLKVALPVWAICTPT